MSKTSELLKKPFTLFTTWIKPYVKGSPLWFQAFIVVVYFLFLGFLSRLLPWDFPFYVLLWPLYVLPKQPVIAALLEIAFVYFVSIFVAYFIEQRIIKKK